MPVIKRHKGSSAVHRVFMADLEAENARLRQLLEAERQQTRRLTESHNLSGLGQWDFDHTTNKLAWNAEVFELFEVDAARVQPTYEMFLAIVHPEDRQFVHELYTASLETGVPYKATHRLQFPDGRTRWVYETCRTEFSVDKKPVHSTGTVQDVTMMKENELKLQKALEEAEEAGKARLAFLSRMSHELRTPMHGVLGMLSILADEEEKLSPAGRDALDAVRGSADGLLRLLDGILDMSRLENDKLTLANEPFNVVRVVQSVCRLHSTRGAHVEVRVLDGSSAPPALVVGDSDRFAQIVQNLVGNAIKFTPTGGHVVVTLGQCRRTSISNCDRGKTTPAPTAKAGALYQENSVIIKNFGKQCVDSPSHDSGKSEQSVPSTNHDIVAQGELGSLFVEIADNGIGIPGGPSEWEAVFELFHQAHWPTYTECDTEDEPDKAPRRSDSVPSSVTKGSGMGLAISRELARLMGGDVWILSSVAEGDNTGTVFRIELPLPADRRLDDRTSAEVVAAPDLASDHACPKSSADSKSAAVPLNILIADDNLTNRKIFTHMLSRGRLKAAHHVSTCALTGLEALQVLGVPDFMVAHGATSSSDIKLEDVLAKLPPLRFDVILMDRHMPIMDGIKATRILRKFEAVRDAARAKAGLAALPSVLVAAVTASALNEERDFCLENGSDFFLAKPFTQDRLDELISSMSCEWFHRSLKS